MPFFTRPTARKRPETETTDPRLPRDASEAAWRGRRRAALYTPRIWL